MALRGAEIDPDSLRTPGGISIYLNTFRRTRAWLGADERAYAPGDILRGTAYLKNSPHHARRQLLLSQVDVYLSPECVRRKRNITHETRGIEAKRQDLTEICYMRRSAPGSSSYRTYYQYGSTIPPRDSPFQGPYQAQYHYRAQRFAGTPSNESHHPLANDDDDTSIGSGDSLSNRLPHNESVRSQQKAPGEDENEEDEEGDSTNSINLRGSSTEPGPIRCCVFKASRDGGPQPFPSTQYEAPFRFQLRIPDDAPESFAWAETKDGCCIELRYRIFVVFKLRAQPRDISHADDPLYWEGAIRTGENPLIVLFSESYVDIAPRPNALPRDDVYFKHAALHHKPKGGQLQQARKSQPKKRSLFGRRSLYIEVENGNASADDDGNVNDNDADNNNGDDGQRRHHRVGDNIKLNVRVKCARPNSVLPVLPSQDDGDGEDAGESGDGVRACDLKVELVEKVVLRQGRKEIRAKSVRTIMGRCAIEESGTGSTTIEVRTDEGDIYPSAHIGNLVVRHELRVTLLPGRSRLSLCTRVPITLAGGEGQFIQRVEQNETLYPSRGRQPPWRRERTRRQERERKKREEISRIINTLPVYHPKEHDDDEGTAHGDYESEEDVCAICLDDTSAKKAVILRCNHQFHAECVKDWMVQKAECPSCRIPVLE